MTAKVTAASTIIALALGTLAAYGLSRFTFRAGPLKNSDISFFFISQRIMPPAVLAIPYFLLLRYIGLLDTHLGLILVYMIITLPLSVWMLTSYFRAIPVELEEAAIIDGSTRLGVLFRITLPLSLPGLVAIIVYAFVTTWNEFSPYWMNGS